MQEFTPIQYLQIDISNNYQGDKLDWDDRIAWFKENEPNLEDLLNTAEEPALYHAGVQAYRAMQRGEPTGYPISLDAVASGMQILSVLTNCEKSARHCGIVSTGHREDPYINLYMILCDNIGDTGKIERKDTKRAIMTAFYNSTAIPKEVFGEGVLLQAFYKVLETEAPGAWELNQAINQLWNPQALSHDWVLPDNFHVKVKVMSKTTEYVNFLNAPYAVDLNVNEPTKEGRSLPANVVHSVDGFIVREMLRRCNYDKARIDMVRASIGSKGQSACRPKDKMMLTIWNQYINSGYLSVRILEYIDDLNIDLLDQEVIMNMLKSLPAKPFPVLTIHDCFRIHPNYGNDLRRQYNLIMSQIAKSDMLSFIASQIAGRNMPVSKMGDISAKILEADYALS